MIEAIPKSIKTPEAEELLKVGIVLEEDKKTDIRIEPVSGSVLQTDSEKLSLSAVLRIKVEGGSLRVTDEAGEEVYTGETFLIKSPDIHAIEPGGGTWIDSVVAGRIFHWRKELKQCLPGDFELSVAAGYLILVNIVPFENYLACVGSSEMSAECPIDFAKAQITAARSWTKVFLGDKHPDEPFDVCNDDDCQRYQGTTHLEGHFLKRVMACKGEYLITQEGDVCPAYYSKSCGGVIEESENIFGYPAPGLRSEPDTMNHEPLVGNLIEEKNLEKWLDLNEEQRAQIYCSDISVKEETLKKYIGAVDEAGKYFRWEYTLKADLLVKNLKEKFSVADVAAVRGIEIVKRSASGRATHLNVKYLTEGGLEDILAIESQYDIRRALHESFLFSTAFLMNSKETEEGFLSSVDFKGAGWGHGVGFCQIGALGMALKGKGYVEILKHYYPETELIKAY